MQRIRFWQHGRAVRQLLRAYPPGTDALVDRIRSAGFLMRFALQRLLLPLYFAREQGWTVRGERHRMAAIMYLRRTTRQGIRVMHIEDITVDAAYRRRGCAQRLMALAEELARAAFPRGNVVMQMRDALGTIYSDDQFADLFPVRGQPAEAPWRLALVTVLQFMEHLPDRQAADAVRSRLDWKSDGSMRSVWS